MTPSPRIVVGHPGSAAVPRDAPGPTGPCGQPPMHQAIVSQLVPRLWSVGCFLGDPRIAATAGRAGATSASPGQAGSAAARRRRRLGSWPRRDGPPARAGRCRAWDRGSGAASAAVACQQPRRARANVGEPVRRRPAGRGRRGRRDLVRGPACRSARPRQRRPLGHRPPRSPRSRRRCRQRAALAARGPWLRRAAGTRRRASCSRSRPRAPSASSGAPRHSDGQALMRFQRSASVTSSVSSMSTDTLRRSDPALHAAHEPLPQLGRRRSARSAA